MFQVSFYFMFLQLLQKWKRGRGDVQDATFLYFLQINQTLYIFTTLILGCLIAITLFVTSCICRTKFAKKESSDKHKIETHIHRLENYVLGIERSDFKEDLIKINAQINNKNHVKKSNNPKNNPPSNTPIGDSCLTHDNIIVSNQLTQLGGTVAST